MAPLSNTASFTLMEAMIITKFTQFSFGNLLKTLQVNLVIGTAMSSQMLHRHSIIRRNSVIIHGFLGTVIEECESAGNKVAEEILKMCAQFLHLHRDRRIMKSGWVNVQNGGISDVWNRRWIELDYNGVVCCYGKHNYDLQPIVVFNFDRVLMSSISANRSVSLSGRSGNLVLCCSNEQERNAWLRVFLKSRKPGGYEK